MERNAPKQFGALGALSWVFMAQESWPEQPLEPDLGLRVDQSVLQTLD